MVKNSTKKGTLIDAVAKKEEQNALNNATELLTHDVTNIMNKAEVNDRRITELELTCEDLNKKLNELKAIVNIVRGRMGVWRGINLQEMKLKLY